MRPRDVPIGFPVLSHCRWGIPVPDYRSLSSQGAMRDILSRPAFNIFQSSFSQPCRHFIYGSELKEPKRSTKLAFPSATGHNRNRNSPSIPNSCIFRSVLLVFNSAVDILLASHTSSEVGAARCKCQPPVTIAA